MASTTRLIRASGDNFVNGGTSKSETSFEGFMFPFSNIYLSFQLVENATLSKEKNVELKVDV